MLGQLRDEVGADGQKPEQVRPLQPFEKLTDDFKQLASRAKVLESRKGMVNNLDGIKTFLKEQQALVAEMRRLKEEIQAERRQPAEKDALTKQASDALDIIEDLGDFIDEKIAEEQKKQPQPE
jgi:hypothetical protein